MKQTYIRRKIKAEAQFLLSGNWLKSFLLLIIQTFLMAMIFSVLPIRVPMLYEIAGAGQDAEQLARLFLPNGITPRFLASFGIMLLLLLLVLSPLSVGIARFFLGVARGEKPKVRDVFAVYANLGTVFSSIWLEILLMLIYAFWTMVFMIVPVLFMFAGILYQWAMLYNIGAFLIEIMSVFALLWNSRYHFAKLIFAEGETGAFSSIRECIELMRGRTKECIVLRLSYALWNILTLYMPLLWFPYFALSNTVYAKYLYYLRTGAAFSDEPPHMAF